MPVLNVEEEDKDLPILCIIGEPSPLRDAFLREKQKEFRIILISTKKPDFPINNLYFITYKDSIILARLEETIDYGLLFLEDLSTKEYLLPTISKLTKDKSKSVFLISAPKIDSFYDVILDVKHHSFFHFALIGEVISKEEAQKNDTISRIIYSSFQKKEIKLTGNDLLPIYPISLPDALTSTQHLLFGRVNKGAMYYIFYKSPETILSAIHILSKVEPDLKITFSDEDKLIKPTFGRDDIHEIVTQKLRMDETYLDDQFEGFENAVSNLTVEGVGETAISEITRKRTFQIHPHIKRGGSFLLTTFLLGTLLFILVQGIAFAGGAFYLRQAIKSLEKEKFTDVAKNARKATAFFQIIKPTVYIATDFTRFADRENNVLKTFQLIERALSLSELAGETISTLSKKEINEKDMELLIGNFAFLHQEGERIKIENTNKALENLLKPEYSKLLSISQTLPQILGYKAERNYILLLQNNGELRPTGGFIGSIGELRVKNGEIEELKIQDVYEYDGQLKSHIEPPFVIRRYLQPHLYLRDSNFYLDFQESASKAAMIYNLETKRTPDGVIAINFEVLRKILEITGPVKLPDYNVTIDEKNVFDYLQATIEKDFFPGSTQKKDVLTALFNKLLVTLEEKPQTWLSIAKLLPTLMEEKHVLFSFQEQSIQKIFNANSYGGQIEDKRVRESKTIYDYLYINEANIGINKANMLLTRNVSYEALLGEDRLLSTAKLTLNNPEGNADYKSYLQVVVPRESKLLKIIVNGEEQKIVPAITDPKIFEAKNFKAPEGLEVEEFIRGGNTYFSFIANVKAGQSSTITIQYENGSRKSLTSRTSYSLLYVKQPGTLPYEFNAALYYPENYTPDESTASSFGKNFIRFNDTLINDKEYFVTLQRNN